MNIPYYPMRPMNGGRIDLKEAFLEPHIVEPKLNDWRCLIHRPSRHFWSRYGDDLSIATKFKDAFAELDALLPKTPEFDVLDCLGIGRRTRIGDGCLYVLDLPEHPGMFVDRKMTLGLHLETHRYDQMPATNRAYAVQSLATLQAGDDAYVVADWMNRLKELNTAWGEEFYEGCVCKRLEGYYTKQLRNPDLKTPEWLKFRWAY